MPQEVLVNGVVYVFPDDANEEQISRSLKKMLAPPPAPAGARPVPAPARPARRRSSGQSDPMANLTLGGGPVPAERPTATVESLAERAAALRLAGEVDKALLIEKQIDAMRAREQRLAANAARDIASKEALTKGRQVAAQANITTRETDAPARPPVPLQLPEADLALIPVPGSLGEQIDAQRVAEERARAIAERRGLPVSETAALIEQEGQQEREGRARTVSAGGVVEEGPTPLFPILRPTRIQEVPRALLEEPTLDEADPLGESFPFGESEQAPLELGGRLPESDPSTTPEQGPPSERVRAYRDPSTGTYSIPTTGEKFTEAFARQPIMGESDALAFALSLTDAPPESKSALRNLITQRVEGQGIVETPLGASMRGLGGLTPAFITTSLMGPLLRTFDIETTRENPVAFGADPTAKRGVGRSGDIESFDDFMTDYSEGIQQGRGIGDELAQITPLVKATAELAGENEEWARNSLWAVGTLAEMLLPATPLGLPGKLSKVAQLGSKATGAAAKAGMKVATRVAPQTASGLARAVEQVAEGAKFGAGAAPALIRDRALLGTIAKRTFGEDVARSIPRLASEDEIVRVVSTTKNVPAEEVRTILRSQVPDNLVQITDSVAARKGVASQLLSDAQAEVKALAPRGLTPEEVSRLLDNTLVAKAKGGKPGLKLMDELTARSLSPVPPGVEPSLFDGIVFRTFAALAEDVLPRGVVRPDNALAAALYKRVQASTFRATQNLRDDIVEMAKTISRDNPGLTAEQAKNRLLESVFNKHLNSAEGLEKLTDKIVEDGLGRIAGLDVKRTGTAVLNKIRSTSQVPSTPPTNLVSIRDAYGVMNKVAGEIGIPLKNPADRLLPLMAATIIEDVQKAALVGEKGSALKELTRLQRGRAARFGESATPSGAKVEGKLRRLGDDWAKGAEQSFKPADMFEPEALNAAWTDSLGTALGKAGALRKRFNLYTASQLGPIPNAPAWLDRFLRGGITSAAQIGYMRTGAAARDALRFRYAPGNAVLFTGADGIEWTKDLIKAEGRRVGLGLSAQDSARQGLMNEVLISRVDRALTGPTAVKNPRTSARPQLRAMDEAQLRRAVRTATIGPDYAAMAGAASDAYREAVFAGALREGMTIDQAAQVARRSLLDYSLVPTGQVADVVTQYFASAAETWGGMTALRDALLRNPSAPMDALRMQNFLNRTRDPMGVMGDESKRTVLSLPIGPDNYDLMLGTNPAVWAMEGVLGTIGALDAGVVGVGEVLAGDKTILNELEDVAGAGLRLAGGVLLGELEPRTQTAAAPQAGVLTDTELMGLLLHLSAPDGQRPEWRPFIDSNLPRKIVPPPKESALASVEGYKDLGPLRIWKNLPPNWSEKGLIWERISPEEVDVIVRQYPNLASSAPSFVKVYALEPEAKTLLRGLRGRSQGVLDDAARYAASVAAQDGLEGTVGVPASTEDPNRVLIEWFSRRGLDEPGAAEKKAVEALRATRAGE